jgi:hypothetical protein
MKNNELNLKPWIMWLAMFLLMALLAHVIIESTVQLFLANHSGIWRYLSEFRNNAQKDGLSLDQYGKKVGLDAYLGWGKTNVRIHEPSSNLVNIKTILFVGDSVTAGHDVRAGEEDYPARIAAMLGDKGARIVNLAVRGYGVDQMWLKLLTTAGKYHPDAVFFAYIPHDLIRPANDFIFGLPKPRFRFSGSRGKLALAEEIADFNQDYDDARGSFRLSWWFLSHYWKNKEYYAPALFTDYYARLYHLIGDGLAQLSQEWGIPVIVVKLTNIDDFKGSRKLIQLAASGLVHPTGWQSAKVNYLDLDPCVKPKAIAQEVDIDKEFYHHPGSVGHTLMAECLGDYIDSTLISPSR